MKVKYILIQAVLMSLFLVSCGGGITVPSPQIDEASWQGKVETHLNFQSPLFYPQASQTKQLFDAERKFTDPFHSNDTDVFMPTVTAINSTSQTVTLTVIVNLPASGSFTLTVSSLVNNTALYLSIPDQNGVLKKSSVPFGYVAWDRGAMHSSSFAGVIDYTAPDQLKWV